ncbi:MAG: S-adenosylmethionine synthase [Tepidiforma sp.]|nr:MAG: S-adenosylmethionine synthase [Tepidiforma sp.]
MRSQLFPAEFVLPGHPDKLADAVADALVAEAGRRERRALVGLEVAVHRRSVFITGRIACSGATDIDIDGIARQVYASAGFGSPVDPALPAGDRWTPLPETLTVATDLCLGPLLDGEEEGRAFSDDQSIVTGYAVDSPGTNDLPAEHWLAGRLARALERLRSERPDLLLGPDGKVIIVLERQGPASRLRSFSTSLQQAPAGDPVELRRSVRGALEAVLSEAAEAIPGLEPDLPDIEVNGAGNFVFGGPDGDNGLSGKKLVIDAYGPRVPIGGGALSGKDLYKPDRAGAIIARRLARLVVRTGAAPECTATLAVFPGDERFRVVSLRGAGGEPLDPARWEPFIDLSLAGAGDRWTGAADLVDVARYGHFLPGRPWETFQPA